MNFNASLLIENLSALNVNVSDEQIKKLDFFAYMLAEKNKQMNLTAILDEDSVAIKHFADSLSILTVADIHKGTKVLDVGTGAGFPGIPLLIVKPDMDLTLIDSTAKKLAFVSESVESLGLKANVIHARAEDLAQNADYRETYDYVVSRAVASLNVLCEYCLPFVKLGGKFISMKGSKAPEEIVNAKQAISVLGGKLTETKTFSFSDEIERNLVIIEKIAPTPQKYPRVSAQILKKPL